MADENQLYFAYGSNMDRRRMAERGVQFDRAKSALLRGHVLRFNKRSVSMAGSGAANVVPCAEGEVEGVLYHLPDMAQIHALDLFEGYPDGYRRESLPIRVRGGAVETAWVYLANAHYIDDALKPRRAYLEHLLAARPFLSSDYYTRLARVKCMDD